ncbi:MAG: enoyl-CoA hydratase/isomerase family protein [Planctomycetota bacterium]|nr:MAG: enoyl-CoA hydratase/isomerase family protein [Planctomycetota bacterium]
MIELEQRGTTTILRLQRGKGNALNIELLEAIERALGEIEASDARAAIVTGQGSVFGAGVDLPEMVAGGEAYIRRFVPLLVQVFERLATFPKPLVAAVNGHAVAGGAILMLACDQRLLARGNARIGLTEIQVGVPFPAWALEIARFATPPEHFATLICTGRTWSPDEALTRGLVDEVIEPERLPERAFEVAREMGALLPATFAATKLAVRRPLIEAVRKTQSQDEQVVEAWCSPEVQKAMEAFAERTIKRKG